MKLNRSRIVGIALIILGLVLWMLISPQVIGLSQQALTFVSPIGWLGVSITMLGVAMVIIGVSKIIVA
jgi:hypothetical protein